MAIGHIRMENISLKVQARYEDSLHHVDLTAPHACVYDPIAKSTACLDPVDYQPQELAQRQGQPYGAMCSHSILSLRGRIFLMTVSLC